jgi:hypothetical protein
MSHLKSGRFRIIRGAMNFLKEPCETMFHRAFYLTEKRGFNGQTGGVNFFVIAWVRHVDVLRRTADTRIAASKRLPKARRGILDRVSAVIASFSPSNGEALN